MDRTNLRWFEKDGSRESLVSIALREGQVRGLSSFEVEVRYPISAIAGRNGTGKSSILAMAACAFHSQQVTARKSYYTFSDFFIQSSGELGPQGVLIEYRIRGMKSGKAIDNLLQRKKPQGGKWTKYETRPKRNVVYIGFQRAVPFYESQVHKSYRRQFKPTLLDEQIRARVATIAGRILGKNYSDFVPLQHRKHVLPRVSDGGITYSGFNMGAGESAVIHIIGSLLEVPPGSLLVVDEIELGLHEEAQQRLVDELKELCSELKSQIICTTHSHAILHKLPPEARFFIERVGGQTVVQCGISADFACGKMGRVGDKELDVFVEDEVAERIVRAYLPRELRQRCRIIKVGSADSIVRLMASRVIEDRRNCICVFDGDQRKRLEEHIRNVRSYCDGELSERADEIEEWARNSAFFLPGDEWPEKWIAEKTFKLAKAGNCAAMERLAEKWELSGCAHLSEVAERVMASQKHSEFFEFSVEVGFGEDEVTTHVIDAVREIVPDALADVNEGVGKYLNQAAPTKRALTAI